MQPSGNLSDISLPSLFHKISISKTTGVLRLTQGQMIKEISFLGGRPVFAKSNLLSEALGRVLLNKGLISQNAYDKSLAAMKASKKLQGEILKEIGAMTISVEDALRLQTEVRLVNCFQWKDGTYTFRPMKDLPPGTGKYDLAPSSIIYQGVKISYTLEELQDKFSGFLDIQLCEGKSPHDITEMGLSPGEIEMIRIIDGDKTTRDIIEASTLGLQETLGLLFALLILEFFRPVPKEAAQAPPPEPPSPPRAAEEPAVTPEDLSLKASLEETLSRMRGQNHYQILGLAPGASPDQSKKAYYQRAREYHPDHFYDKPEEIKTIAHEIFTLVTQAHSILINPDERKKYEEFLRTGKTEDDVARETAGILNAEISYQKGLALLKKGDIKGAEEHLRTARDLNPNEAEYHIYHGWTLFRLAPPGQGDFSRAKEAINTGLTMDKKIAQGYYFLGMIYKREGREGEAKEYFLKSIAGDPNHVDALREVRLMTMRERKEDKGLFGKIFK